MWLTHSGFHTVVSSMLIFSITKVLIVTSLVFVMFLVLGFVMFYFGFPCPVTLDH